VNQLPKGTLNFMGKLRAAIVGTGSIAHQHADAIRQFPDQIELVAAVNATPEVLSAFAAKYGISHTYSSTTDMLKDHQPDLVHICTPPRSHTALIIECLGAGAWVLCEKPLCASLAEFDRITQAENETGRFVSTLFQWRFGSGAQHLKRLIHEGELGQPLVALAYTLWYRGLAYYTDSWHGKWATEVGGTVLMHGIHLMDLLLWLMPPEWDTVQAMMGTLDRPIEVEDAAIALVKFQNGALASVMSSAVSPRQESYLRLDFQNATAEVRSLYYAYPHEWQFSVAENSPHAERYQTRSALPDSLVGDHAAQLAQLLKSLGKNERPPVSGEDARRPLEFVTSLYKAALTGQTVQRGSITPDDPFYYAMNGRP
jgi:predicted dehydrogenase